MTSILWRRLDAPGHDAARLREDAHGAAVEGTAVFAEAGLPCRLDYLVVCDPAWRTLSARVTGWVGATAIDLAFMANAQRAWTLNGQPCAAVEGCDDIDLSFTPATNLLPIRWLHLAVGAQASVRAAWLRLDGAAVVVEPLHQIYARVSPSTYRYESGGGSFVAMLEANAHGLVTRYQGLWELAGAG